MVDSKVCVCVLLNKVVVVVLIGNFVIVVVKFIVVGVFGSLVMFSEGVYLLVDMVNELLLLYGLC